MAGLKKTRLQWTQELLAQLAALFPHHSTSQVAVLMGLRVTQVNGQADRLGLRKTAEHLNSPASGRIMPGEEQRGLAGRFKTGNTSWNKGRTYNPGGRSPQTRFRKGCSRSGRAAEVYKPIGTVRVTKDGYLQQKISDTGLMHRRWRGVQIIAWETANGPLPKGHALCFIDGNPGNCALDNLQLVSRAELMRRNTIHKRLPPDLRAATQVLGQLKRRIRERIARNHQPEETTA